MGNQALKAITNKSEPNTTPQSTSALIIKIHCAAQLNKERKKALAANKEKDLLLLINQKASIRNQTNEVEKVMSILTDIKMAAASELIIKYCNQLQQSNVALEDINQDPNKIKEITPLIESVIFGCQKCTIEAGTPLHQAYCRNTLGQEPGDVDDLANVSHEIQDLLESRFPSVEEMTQYLKNFCDTKNVTLDKLNEAGHNVGVPLSTYRQFPALQINLSEFQNKSQLLFVDTECANNSHLSTGHQDLSPIWALSPFPKGSQPHSVATPSLVTHFFPVDVVNEFKGFSNCGSEIRLPMSKDNFEEDESPNKFMMSGSFGGGRVMQRISTCPDLSEKENANEKFLCDRLNWSKGSL